MPVSNSGQRCSELRHIVELHSPRVKDSQLAPRGNDKLGVWGAALALPWSLAVQTVAAVAHSKQSSLLLPQSYTKNRQEFMQPLKQCFLQWAKQLARRLWSRTCLMISKLSKFIAQVYPLAPQQQQQQQQQHVPPGPFVLQCCAVQCRNCAWLLPGAGPMVIFLFTFLFNC